MTYAAETVPISKSNAESVTGETSSPSVETEQLRAWHRELLAAGAAWEHATALELRRGMACPFTSSSRLAQRVDEQLSLLRAKKGYGQ